MTKPARPLIVRAHDRATGEFKWIATSPPPSWANRWVSQRPVPFWLMMLAQRHARKLNDDAEASGTVVVQYAFTIPQPTGTQP